MLPPALSKALADYAELKTLSVKWTERLAGARGTADRLGWKDAGIPGSPHALDLVWQRGKIYVLSTNQQRRGEFAFDGRILAGGNPDRKLDSMPRLLIDLAAEKDSEAEYFGVGSLQPLGIHFPHGVGELLKAKPLESHFWFLLQHGGELKAVGSAAIDGSPMLQATILADNRKWHSVQNSNVGQFQQLEMMLRTSPKKWKEEEIQEQLAKAKSVKEVEPRRLQHVVYFDPTHGYVVRRWQELTEDGRLRVQSECTEPEKAPGSKIWLPRKCRTDEFTSPYFPGEVFTSPYNAGLVDVSEYGTTPVPDERFTLKYTVPGSQIADNTLPESKLGKGPVSYIVPDNPKDLDQVIAEARRTRVGTAALGPVDLVRPRSVLCSLAGLFECGLFRASSQSREEVCSFSTDRQAGTR